MSKVVDYEALWSKEGAALQASTLAGFVAKFAGKAGVVKMHVGLPPDVTFPLTSISVATSTGDHLDISDPAKLSIAQQYMFSNGYPDLVQWAQRIVTQHHKPTVPVDIVFTAGSVHAISNIIMCMADRGDTLVVDEFTYAHVAECIFIPRGLTLLPIRMDSAGMDPVSLDAQLSAAAAAAAASGSKPPKLMYIVPVAHNPTGIVLSVERKRRIYEVCQKHNICIIEDDAYYWLQFYKRDDPSGSSAEVPGLDVEPSFLSLDTDSRVIRIDTMAKLMGPGYRIGWVTCAPKLAEKLGMAIQGNCCGANSLSMVLLAEVIKTWGDAKFEEFVRSTQRLYRSRGEAASKAAEEHLTGVAEWVVPRAGMFMWMKFTGIEDFDEQLVAEFVEQGVVGVPGRLFWAETEKAASGSPCPFMRISFGTLTEPEIVEGVRRMGVALRNVAAAAAAAAK